MLPSQTGSHGNQNMREIKRVTWVGWLGTLRLGAKYVREVRIVSPTEAETEKMCGLIMSLWLSGLGFFRSGTEDKQYKQRLGTQPRNDAKP